MQFQIENGFTLFLELLFVQTQSRPETASHFSWDCFLL